MKNRKLRIAVYAIAILVILATVVIYPYLPAKIPGQWRTDGSVRYDDKYIIWLMTGLMLGLALLLDYAPKFDPRGKNYEKFGTYYDGFCVIMQLFMAVMWSMIITESFKLGTVTVWKVVTLLCGGLFMWLGNMIPKVKSNFSMGIRTPWSLVDEDNWRRSNRLGGKSMFLAGVAVVLSGLFLPEKLASVMMIVVVLAAAGLPCVMSYVWWRQKEQRSGKDS